MKNFCQLMPVYNSVLVLVITAGLRSNCVIVIGEIVQK